MASNLVQLSCVHVRPEFRQHPMVRELARAALAYVGNRNAYMSMANTYHSRSMQELYVFRSALPFVSRFALQQVGGPSVLDVEGDPDVPSVMFVRDYGKDVLDDIIRYDMEVTRILRPRYVQLTLEEQTSLVKVAIRKQTGIVCGFGVIQEELRGRSAVLRHVYAENVHVAKILIQYLVTQYPLARSKGVQLVVPVVQDQSWTLLEDFGVPCGSQYPIAHLCFSHKEVDFDYRRMYVF